MIYPTITSSEFSDILVPYCGGLSIQPTVLIVWVLSVWTSLRKSQAKTIVDLRDAYVPLNGALLSERGR
jgi:hypothetical protein